MPRPRVIEWPDKAKICVTFIIPWEVWPENFATRESLQRQGTHTIPPVNAVFKKTLAAVTERECGDRLGIWRIMDMFDRYGRDRDRFYSSESEIANSKRDDKPLTNIFALAKSFPKTDHFAR
jgi:hypothetical protein